MHRLFLQLCAFLCPLLVAAAPVRAELRDFCALRPGLGTSACTVDAGHMQVEIGLADWTLDRQPDTRTDSVVAGDILMRVGIDRVTEVQVGWTAYGHVRVRDRSGGLVSRSEGTGDVRIGLQRSLSGPGGQIGVQPFVTLPTGGAAIGAGDWGAGVVVPIGFDLGHGLALALTPEVDAAVDSDGSGRHLAYGNVVGVSGAVTKTLNLTVEVAATRDEDPAGHTTTALASTSLAWMRGKNTQIDLGAVAGLNAQSPDVEVYFGIARRF